MVQGGAANSTNLDKFIENVVKYMSERKDLLEALESLLQANGFVKSGETFNESTIKDVSQLLMQNQLLLKGTMEIVKEHLEKDDNQLKMLLEQENKVKGMEKELETLGNQLLAQGLISGAAVTTITGALAGTLAIGGVTGALIVGGAALVGFVALVAIAAIGYLIYQNRGEIKEGAMKAGKEVKSFVKDVIDKLPTFQARKNNFSRLEINTNESLKNVTSKGQGDDKNKEYIKDFSDNIAILNMLQDQKKRSAIQELVENGTIKNFSKDDMTRLLKKGLSTHEEDMEKLLDLMKDFLPAIMASGNNEIEKVEEIVNKKVEEMKPYSQVENVSLKQGKEGKGKG